MMAWSRKQQVLAVRAANAAGWTPRQRYMVMTSVGCVVTSIMIMRDRRVSRPSVKHARNTNRQFELYMELAEISAIAHGSAHLIGSPAAHDTWGDAARAASDRVIGKIYLMFYEAEERIPSVIGEDAIEGFVVRMTRANTWPIGEPRDELKHCTGAQIYRIMEGARAWLGREYVKRGMTPQTFTIPASIRATAPARRGAVA